MAASPPRFGAGEGCQFSRMMVRAGNKGFECQSGLGVDVANKHDFRRHAPLS
jgi:hypothetical protein